MRQDKDRFEFFGATGINHHVRIGEEVADDVLATGRLGCSAMIKHGNGD